MRHSTVTDKNARNWNSRDNKDCCREQIETTEPDLLFYNLANIFMTIIELICSPEPALDIETGNKSNPYPATRKQLARRLPKFRYTTNTETLCPMSYFVTSSPSMLFHQELLWLNTCKSQTSQDRFTLLQIVTAGQLSNKTYLVTYKQCWLGDAVQLDYSCCVVSFFACLLFWGSQLFCFNNCLLFWLS